MKPFCNITVNYIVVICCIYLHFKLLLLVVIVNNHSVMQLVTSLTPQRITLDPRPIHAGNTVIKLQWDRCFCKYYCFLLLLSFHQYCMLTQFSPMSYNLINCLLYNDLQKQSPSGKLRHKTCKLTSVYPL